MANKKKVQVTEEELKEIRAHNKKVLDDLFANPNWRYELGKKHFGEKRWQKVMFGEDHPEYKEWRLDPNREKIADTHRPISEWDADGNLIDTYETVDGALEKYGWERAKGINVLDSCRDSRKLAYGRKWKFEDID